MVDLQVETAGDGPPVLWIHGYTMDSTLWRPLWELLPGFRHIGVDLPGHGRSAPLRPEETLPALADRVGVIARAERASRVVALSFGSCLALQLAAQQPALVRTLAVAAPTIAGAPPAAGTVGRERQLRLLHRMAGPGPHLTRLWMMSPPDIFLGAQAHPELWERIRQVVDRHSWAELSGPGMRTLSSHVHADAELGRISARTLVMVGDADMPEFAANAARLAAAVPDCAVHEVPDAGHLCLLERPEQAAGALRAHLAGAGSADEEAHSVKGIHS